MVAAYPVPIYQIDQRAIQAISFNYVISNIAAQAFNLNLVSAVIDTHGQELILSVRGPNYISW